MKNKAFTLVELLGVIVLLGILGVVIIPKVGDSITNSKETAYITQEEQIKKAANDFIVDNIELFDNTNTITIKLGVLKQKGYLPINIKNPKTRKNISNESTITITKTNEKFEITLNLIDLIEVTENIDNNSPIIVLNGNYVEYINVNSNETEINNNLIQNGAKAYSSTGEELTEITTQIKIGETEKTSIKTNTLDTYEITYTVTYNGKTTSATRTVIIRDTESPQITLPKETILHISEVEQFDIMKDVIIQDNHSSNSEITINVESNLSNLPGNYVITYTATDASRNQTIKRRVINVDGNFANHYTNLEYIESTGTQYINTGYIPTSMTDMEIEFAYIGTNDASTSVWYPICGERSGGGSTYLGFWVNRNDFKIAVNYGVYDSGNSSTQSISRNARFNLKNSGSKFYLNGNMFTSSTTQVTKGTTPIYIFTIGNGSGVENRHVLMKLYSFKIYENNVLVRNMLPCIRNSDNTVGLYDLVNNKFYTNEGEGEFIKGNPIN